MFVVKLNANFSKRLLLFFLNVVFQGWDLLNTGYWELGPGEYLSLISIGSLGVYKSLILVFTKAFNT